MPPEPFAAPETKALDADRRITGTEEQQKAGLVGELRIGGHNHIGAAVGHLQALAAHQIAIGSGAAHLQRALALTFDQFSLAAGRTTPAWGRGGGRGHRRRTR